MKRRIFRAICTVALTVLLASLALTAWATYRFFEEVVEDQLSGELATAAAGVEEGGTAFLARLSDPVHRLTWIDGEGRVIYDTWADPAAMENHAGRTEFLDALAHGSGEDVRYSATLTERTIYRAVRLSDGTVLRISASQATAAALSLDLLPLMAVAALLAALVSRALAGRMARQIVEPFERVDLERPLEHDTYDELSPFLSRIHRQRGQIEEQLAQLRHKTEEFDQVTSQMREGLVLLDGRGDILTINPAACAIFGAEPSCVGSRFLTVDRGQEMEEAIRLARETGHARVRAGRGGRRYQMDVSRIGVDGEVAGSVILAMDVTEQEDAERSRREFTANVSHELKTPLQSVLGSAELLENGLVRPEDLPRFYGRIRSEAARMAALIDDILRLAQLDEGASLPREEADLLSAVREAAAVLEEAAARRGVSITVEGEPCPVAGAGRLAYEIAYNLMDNAVRYNVEGGRVDAAVSAEGEACVLTVADTGIGIPPEHQERVFERFYRVDKSRSRQSGGTGLGLSIVKHAARCAGAQLSLSSEPGRGTTVTVTFPRG